MNHLLAVSFFLLVATNAFQFPSSISIRARSSPIVKNAGFDNPLPTITTALHGKLWKRLQIEEDDPAMGTSWYLINCVAGVELDLLNQCRYVCAERGFPKTDVEKFVVPTERHLRSHGDKKKVVDVKVRYPGYVFCKIRLIEDVYEVLQELELVRSWMGTVNRKGHKKLPPAPLPLNEGEVKRFKGLEEAQELFEDMYGGDYTGRSDTGADLLAQYAGYDVGQMVKILKGNFDGEDGTVRRLKNGQLMVRMFTYGQNFDEWFDPDALRPLTDLEVMRGLGGPMVSIDQNQFDISIGKKDPPPTMDASGGGDNARRMRPGLLQSAGIAPGRNRREDRVARGEMGNRDMFGRSQEDIKREEQNWLEYRERQRAGRREGERRGDAEKVVPKKKKERPPKGKDTWGIVERSSWTGGEYGFDADSEQEEQERKFRTAQIYQDRPQRRGRGSGRGRGRDQRESNGGRGRGGFDDGRRRDARDRRPVRNPHDRQDEDNEWITKASDDDSADKEENFFDSLMNELGNDLSGSGAGGRGSRTRGSLRHDSAGPSGARAVEKRVDRDAEDSFFDNLMIELGGAFDRPSPSSSGKTEGTSDDEDDFFSSLEAELSRSLNDDGPGGNKDLEESSSSDDDFFVNLEKEMGKGLDKTPRKVDRAAQDDFFSSLIDDAADELESLAKADKQDDFFSSLIDTVAGDLEMPVKRDEAEDHDFFSSLIGDFDSDLKTEAKVDEAKEDDFFSSLMDNVVDDLETEAKSTQAELKEARALAREDDLFSSLVDDVTQETSKQSLPYVYGDLSSMTVPMLKDLLRSKGLKVGGKKAELIERLQNSYS